VSEVYRLHPPDILFGWLGTSWRRVQRAVDGFGVAHRWTEGEEELARTLAAGRLAVVMLDVGATSDEGYGGMGGHWTVVYAMDAAHVYVSNWPGDGRCTWRNFRRAWDTPLTRAFYGAPPWEAHRWMLVVPGEPGEPRGASGAAAAGSDDRRRTQRPAGLSNVWADVGWTGSTGPGPMFGVATNE
jgi:hypothetical protein